MLKSWQLSRKKFSIVYASFVHLQCNTKQSYTLLNKSLELEKYNSVYDGTGQTVKGGEPQILKLRVKRGANLM